MKKFILLLDGMTGSGKTTTTNLLSKQLPRTALLGMDRIKFFISDFERGTRDNNIAKDITLLMAKKYLDLGLSVIIDQSFKTEEEIEKYDSLAKDFGVPCIKVQLYSDPDIALERVVKRTKETKSDLPKERVERNIKNFSTRESLGFITIDTTNLKPEEVVQKVFTLLQ
ncbi:MAG: ATP-binding protein [Candidatus Pacebacteria bacterium]|nr:ATP-binding protein [Candidatus Paceibacterota bacterium]